MKQSLPDSQSVEDYLKALYSIEQSSPEDGVPTSTIAEKLGISSPSVTAMIKRLAIRGLVSYTPYHGVNLTDEGRNLALRVLRRHRLVEQMLYQMLEMPWEDVHKEADRLEHAFSDELIEKLAEKLGQPIFDPHGEPIPQKDLSIPESKYICITELPPPFDGIIRKVADSNEEALRYLSECGVAMGMNIRAVEQLPLNGPLKVIIDDREHFWGSELCSLVYVELI